MPLKFRLEELQGSFVLETKRPFSFDEHLRQTRGKLVDAPHRQVFNGPISFSPPITTVAPTNSVRQPAATCHLYSFTVIQSNQIPPKIVLTHCALPWIITSNIVWNPIKSPTTELCTKKDELDGKINLTNVETAFEFTTWYKKSQITVQSMYSCHHNAISNW